MKLIVRPFVRILREANRLGGIRQEPLESWIKDADGCVVPELRLNSRLMHEAFLQLLATGLGALILISASAVVLGGFSTKIKKEDFWYMTAISIIQTAKVFGSISGPTARFFAQFPAFHMRTVILLRRWHVGDAKKFVPKAAMVPILFAVAPIVTALACYGLSAFALSLAIQNYGGSDTYTQRGNIKPALIVFYSLVLAQGVVLILWCVAFTIRLDETERFSREYFGIGNARGTELVDRYITQTQDKCIEKGVFSTTNRTLVSFAAELLQSEHHNDHVSAVAVLHVLTTRKTRAASAVKQISSSEQVVGSLFKLLRSQSPLDLDTKKETAEILRKVARNLRLTDISGAAHSISSLLDPHPLMMRITELRECTGLGANQTQTQTNNTNQGGAEPQSTGEAHISIVDPQGSLGTEEAAAHRRPTSKCFRWLPTRLIRNRRGGAETSSPEEIQIQTSNTTSQGGAEPSSPEEIQIQTSNTTSQGGAEPSSPEEIQIQTSNTTSQGGAEPSSPEEIQIQTSNTTSQGGAEPSSPEEIQIQTSNTTSQGGARDKPLIVHGLMILDKLASDPGNCTEICKTTDLVPKILAPLTHGLLNTLGNDPKTVQIVKASLRVVAKLTSGTCESSSKLRHELISGNGTTARNIMWIMRNSTEQGMRILAVKILTRLTLGQPRMRGFFDPQDSPPAGKEQTVLAVDLRSWEVICLEVGDQFPALVALMNADGTSTWHRAVTAEFLAQICAKSKTGQDRMHRLSSVSNSLSKVLEAIVTTEITVMTYEKWKFLASFLCLAVQIRENLVTAEAFADAVRRLPLGNNMLCPFVEKLKEIIMETDSEDVNCLVITAAVKLVTWTMSIDPVYAHYFQQENIVDKLKDIANAMRDHERCVVLRGDADEMKPYETFQTLVEALKSCLRSGHRRSESSNV